MQPPDLLIQYTLQHIDILSICFHVKVFVCYNFINDIVREIIMEYNFDEIIDRKKTNCAKWDILSKRPGSEDIIPLTVADMDFRVAEPIIRAIIKRTQHGVFGYSFPGSEYYDAVIKWMHRRFGWQVDKKWIVNIPGIVPALNYAVQAFCYPGDKVIVQTPIYPPFIHAVENNGCHIAENPLINEKGKYRMNLEQLEMLAENPKTKLFFLCSPHNPVGRVWSTDELIKAAEICIRNNVIIVSDEIHNDIILRGYKHNILGGLREDIAENSIICTSTNKSFNIAALKSANIIIRNEKIRNDFERIIENNHVKSYNPLITESVIAAYNESEDWLEQLLDYLTDNFKYIKEYFNNRHPEVYVTESEGTYLAWLDFRKMTSDENLLMKRIHDEGRTALGKGSNFGDSGTGYIRLNFACPRENLRRGLAGISKVIDKYY